LHLHGDMLTHARGPSAHVSTLRSPITAGSPVGHTQRETPIRPAAPLSAGMARATLSVMTGYDAGRIVPVEGQCLVIGRGDEADLQVEDAGVSRVHARIVRSPGSSFHIEDMGSTNGTFLHSRRVTVAPLVAGDRVQLGPRTLLRFALTDPIDEQLQAGLYESSVRDPLTRAFNRRYLLSRLAAEVAHARRQSAPLAALMLDVDHFKQFNDHYGHFVGDRVLCVVIAQAMRLLRAGDVLARFGGDEFVVLARDTDLAQATSLGDRVRSSIQDMHLSAGGKVVSITVSVGVASLGELEPHRAAEALVELVDRRLGVAKSEGRNRVCAVDH
jgi:two-component system, cell cycle response regulator